MLRGRKLFITDKHDVCLSPLTLKTTDCLSIIVGRRCPFVLRNFKAIVVLFRLFMLKASGMEILFILEMLRACPYYIGLKEKIIAYNRIIPYSV